MIVNGIDLEGLADDASVINIPPPVAGRVLHVDADFLAYQTTAERADGTDIKTWDDMKHNATVAVHTLRDLAGATEVHLHLTPSSSNKGGRFELAILKPYQGNREDKPKPRYLNIMREWLAKEFPGTLHQLCEADDGMSSEQYASIKQFGDSNLSCIASKDKDLRMVPGLHLDWDTGSITRTSDDYGYIELNEKGKLVGYGQKFFWAQMLMGDTADNINGIPKLTGKFLNIYKPTKEIIAAQRIACDEDLGPTDTGARARAKLAARPPAACGPALTYKVLEDVNSNKEAFQLVKSIYEAYGQELGFFHYTGDPIAWQKVFVAEAQLLWMRRERHNPNCVINWWREINA